MLHSYHKSNAQNANLCQFSSLDSRIVLRWWDNFPLILACVFSFSTWNQIQYVLTEINVDLVCCSCSCIGQLYTTYKCPIKYSLFILAFVLILEQGHLTLIMSTTINNYWHWFLCFERTKDPKGTTTMMLWTHCTSD